MKKWNKSKGQWYGEKELGKLYPSKRHPDYLRDRLNEKGMKRLKRQDARSLRHSEGSVRGLGQLLRGFISKVLDERRIK